MKQKKIVFLTGTRADFGKMKTLMKVLNNSSKFECHVFVTGMHMNIKYGLTVEEVINSKVGHVFKFINHDNVRNMDRTLAKTIEGFSLYIDQIKPDMVIVHGDRVESLAGAIVGSLNNILVGHIEGGELSGTVDEIIRHAVSKMAHIHFVSNEEARNRLRQLGEKDKSIFIIGSPDMDVMSSGSLPSLDTAKAHYSIEFKHYSLAMLHPVTTEYGTTLEDAQNFVNALIESEKNYVVIYPNNDLGSNEILSAYKKLKNNVKFKIFPSIRFEYFLTLLKHAEFMIGNSSAGVREAPFYGVPTVNIGTRQMNRVKLKSIINCGNKTEEIISAISTLKELNVNLIKNEREYFGKGNSADLFYKIMDTKSFWDEPYQKQFVDLR